MTNALKNLFCRQMRRKKQDEQLFWNLTTHQIRIKFTGKSVGPQKQG
jgi:hypothetical protein